ncbi:MAG: hypothetical protein GWP06_01480 [Actinobacteria bacterium]|nr:hypothetical protein [Actinomycetota bacterium]
MLKRMTIISFLLLCTFSFAFGQRKGAIDTGGAFSFQSMSTSDSSFSRLDVNWIFGFYFNRNLIFELEPDIQFDFENEDVIIATSFLGSFAYRVIDMEPDEYRRNRRRKRYDRSTAGIFVSAGGGLWIDGFANSSQPSKTSTGPALMLGIGTHSVLGKLTLLRTKFEYVYLMPSGTYFDKPRSIFKVSAGFSVFIRL